VKTFRPSNPRREAAIKWSPIQSRMRHDRQPANDESHVASSADIFAFTYAGRPFEVTLEAWS
jgi:hypothetical protein